MANKSKGIDSSTSATDPKFTELRRFNLIMGCPAPGAGHLYDPGQQ